MTREQFEDRIAAEDYDQDGRDEYRDELAADRSYRDRWRCSDRMCGAEDCATCHPLTYRDAQSDEDGEEDEKAEPDEEDEEDEECEV